MGIAGHFPETSMEPLIMVDGTVQAPSQAEGSAFLVPSINVEAFPETSGSEAALKSAAGDRRMVRASFTLRHGGIRAATEAYRARATPHLLIVESSQRTSDVLYGLENLAEVCQPETRVIVIGHVNDVNFYRELMRRGVSDYLIAPTTAMQIITSVSALFQKPGDSQIGSVTAFIGAKGGAGSSTIAHNCGWALAQHHGIATIIADLDAFFGTTALHFNQDSTTSTAELLDVPERIDAIFLERHLTKIGSKLSLLAGNCGLDRDRPLDPFAVEKMMAAIRSIVTNAIVDLPNCWSPSVRQALQQADQIVITATPELASLRNTKNLVEYLKAARPNDPPPRLLLNCAGVPRRLELRVEDFKKATGIAVSAQIPYDAQSFSRANGEGRMILEQAPAVGAARAISEFAASLIPPSMSRATTVAKRSSLLAWLRRGENG